MTDDDKKLVSIFMDAQASTVGGLFSENILAGIKAVLAPIQKDMAVILQLACDADEASPKELLHDVAAIAGKHPWPR